METKMTTALETLGSQKNKKELDRLYQAYLNEAYNKLDNLLNKSLEEQAQKQYNYMYRAIERGIRQNLPAGTMTQADITRAINMSIGGATITQRLNGHKATLFKNLTTEMQKQIRQGIAEGMSQGDSIDRMTKTIKEQMNTSRYNARRIARTEAHRMREWGNNWAMEDAKKSSDMFDKEWLSTTTDKRTRDTHRRLDGQFADEDGYFHIDGKSAQYPGSFGIASEDIHCRCTMVANFDKSIGSESYINQDNLNNEDWANKPELPGKYNGLSSTLKGQQLAQAAAFIGTLDSTYYPKSVISKLLQSEFTEQNINDKILKEKLRKIYLDFLQKSYADIGIRTEGLASPDNIIENEYLGKQYALIKHIQDKTGVQLRDLTFKPGSNPNAYGTFWSYKNIGYEGTENTHSMRKINISPLVYSHDRDSRYLTARRELIDGWHGRTYPDGDDTLLITTAHEMGHLLDYKLGWASDKVDYDKLYKVSGYSHTDRSESAAEAFTEVIFNPTEEATIMWESMGLKTGGLNNVEYAKILE